MVKYDNFVESIESDKYIVGLRTDGIIHVYYKDHIQITVELQRELNLLFHKIAAGQNRLFVFQAGHNCSVNKAARDNAIAMQDEVPAIAYVVVVQNLVYRMIANFYYKFNQPKQPFNVVSDFEEGIAWLKELQVANTSKSH